jgi:DNA repair protein RadC
MYHIPVYKVALVKEGTEKVENKKIRRPEDIFQIVKSYMSNLDREHFVVLLLNTQNAVIGINTVSIGTLNGSMVHPREVFKPAILANANCIILCHNHPSGNPEPSREDIEITESLRKAGELLKIEVMDHIIIGDDRYVSFQEKGLM